MKTTRTLGIRSFSGLLAAAVLSTACIIPASAAETIGNGVEATYDEAYYATTDYYGNLTEGSVVKSYVMNGAASLTDYGAYDEVINLTDGTLPHTTDGCTTFDFAGAPSHFYFEGKTAAPFETLPWKLSMHYTLNGVPTKAEELAGKTGIVEIFFDAVPNKATGEYARNNYTLEAMAIFNQDDILSLEAEGAQIQLIGNLRAVLFVVLPGEEQHFSIRVGSDNFSFDGMTFLMVPATLSQLSEISKLSERKDDIEKNYRKLSDSLDALLNSVDSISGNLNATANGLDELNTARGILSHGKSDFKALNDTLDNINSTLHDLQGQLEDFKGDLDGLQSCLYRICSSTGASASDIRNLKEFAEKVKADINEFLPLVTELKIQVGSEDVPVYGKTVSELQKDCLSSGPEELCDMIAAEGSNGDLSSLPMHIDSVISNLADLDSLGADLLDALSDVLDTVDDFGDAVKTYAADLQKTLSDAKTAVTSLMTNVTDTHSLLTSLRDLLKTAGEPLDSGTEKTLEGLADSLRATAKSLGTTGSVKSAKNNVGDIIEDLWNEYTGEANNLLLIDANAAPQSLTDNRNPSPTSIQVLIRTQEIKTAEPSAEEIKIQEAAETTFSQRVAQMFKDFWAAITGIFR